MKRKSSNIEAFVALPDAEKERQWKALDKEFVADSFKTPSRGNRARWQRARKRGRPRIGKGAKVISLSMEQGLLNKADARARKEGISRAELIARALKNALRLAG